LPGPRPRCRRRGPGCARPCRTPRPRAPAPARPSRSPRASFRVGVSAFLPVSRDRPYPCYLAGGRFCPDLAIGPMGANGPWRPAASSTFTYALRWRGEAARAPPIALGQDEGGAVARRGGGLAWMCVFWVLAFAASVLWLWALTAALRNDPATNDKILWFL